MTGPWNGPPRDEDGPVHSWEATWWPVEHGRPAGSGPARAVPERQLLVAAAGAACATVVGLLVLLVSGVVAAVGLGVLVLIGAAVVVSEVERGAR